MSTAKKFIIAYIPIFLIVFALACWYLYYWIYLRNDIPIITAYVDDATYTEGQVFSMEVELYGNENGNGQESFGFKMNCYTDTQLPEKKPDGSYDKKNMFSYGVQFKGGYQVSPKIISMSFKKTVSALKLKNCIYYNSSNGQSFEPINPLKDKNQWVFDIDGQLCLIQEKGEKEIFKALWHKSYFVYDTSLMLESLYNSAKSCEEGENVIMFDMSQYYNILLFDGERFKPLDLKNHAEKFTYINVYIKRSRDGLIDASQSMFGRYDGDPNWTFNKTGKINYWKAQNQYTLTIEDFTVVFENNELLLKLKSNCYDWIYPFKEKLYLLVFINLDDEFFNDKVIAGLSADAFRGLRVNELKITSQTTKDFKYYEPLWDQVVSENVNLIYTGGEA